MDSKAEEKDSKAVYSQHKFEGEIMDSEMEVNASDAKAFSVDTNNDDSDNEIGVSFNVFNVEAMEARDESSAPKTDNTTTISYSWGRGDLGSLFRLDDISSIEDVRQIQLFGNRRIVQVASNSYHSGAVTSTGELYVCGNNEDGQVDPTALDNDNKLITTIFKPRLFESIGNHRVCYVSCGLYHTVCVTATGHAISFGGNDCGQLGHSPGQISKIQPRTVQFNWRGGKKSIISKAFCGDLFTLFLTTSGEVYSCGVGESAGHANAGNVSIAEKIDAFLGLNIVSLATGSSHALAFSSAGELFVWGANNYGQLGLDNDVDHVQIPSKVNFPSADKVIGVSAGYSHSVGWTQNGSLYGAGLNKNGQLGIMLPKVRVFTEIIVDSVYSMCVSAACGSSHTLAIMKSNDDTAKVFGWGSNNFGQINKESTVSMFRSPVEVAAREFSSHKPLYVAAGGDQSFAIVLPSIFVSTDTTSFIATKSNLSDIYMKRQFSTQASRAVVPLGADELKLLISRATDLYQKSHNNGKEFDSRELHAILSIAGELFSSPSLLAGSFVNWRNPPLHLDIDGIENCYKALLQLGTAAVGRLIGSIQQALLEIDSSKSSFAETGVRVLIILWQCPMNSNPLLSADIFKKLLIIWSKLTNRHKYFMMKALLDYPYHLLASRIVKPIQEHLNQYVDSHHVDTSQPICANNNGNDELIRIACDCLSWLYYSTTEDSSSNFVDAPEQTIKKNMLSKDLFYNSSLSSLPSNVLITDFVTWRQDMAANLKAGFTKQSHEKQSAKKRFFICNFPFILNVAAKQRLMLALNAYEQQQTQQMTLQHVMQTGARIFVPYFIIHVQRENLLQQALIQVASADNIELKKPLKVIFDNEEGIDEGGVTKEFFQLLISKLLPVDYGMFVSTNDGRSLWINQNCTWNDEEYRLVGTLLGLAVYNGVLLDIHFPTVWYQKLLQKKPTLDDLASIDPVLLKGLKQMLEYQPAEDVENIFCRSFDVTWEEFGSNRTAELIANGSNIPVTGDNRQLYVDKMVEWILETSIKSQFQQLYNGFTRVIDPSTLLLLRAEELEQLMVGTPQLDFHDLETSTQYISGNDKTIGVAWGPEHPTIQAFWQVVHNLEFEDKQKLLLFVTGSKKAPLGGLKNLGFKIQRMCPDTDALPTSHTCFNVLMLPEYSSSSKLQDRLLKAINECEGFGLK